MVNGGSEGAAAVEEDEDDGRTCQGDQGQGSEVGDQVKIDAHAGDLAGVGVQSEDRTPDAALGPDLLPL